MKKYNLLAITSLVLMSASCDGTKKKLFSIDETQFKVMFHNGENIPLKIENKNNVVIDSVTYFNNDVKIGTVKGNEVLNFKLNSEKLGYQNLKATVFSEGQSQEVTSRIEMVSSIEPKILNFSIINTYPHDKAAFTEGLEFYKGFLYESTGRNGESGVRKTDYKTGKVLQQVSLDPKYFGEGITIVNGKLFELTWQESTGFIYNAETLKLEKTFTYDKKIEGWGMTNDGKVIYQTDGTEKIWRMNPETQEMIDYVNVYTNSSKIKSVNEIEWIEGKIYANVWQKDAIMIVNPQTGAVESVIDLSSLRSKTNATPDDTLNGIAYNPTTKTIFVTGKNWDKMFEIKIN